MKKIITAIFLLLLCAALTACGHEHQWQDATCATPKTCAQCGKTEGEPLGHSWADATCAAPKTCALCGETEGAPLSHDWQEATWDDPKTCSLCGETEGTAKNYFAVNGLDIAPMPEKVTVHGIRYDPDNPEDQEQMDVTIIPAYYEEKPSETARYKDIVYEIVVNLNTRDGENVHYTSANLSCGIYDYYTGRGFPTRSTQGNDGFNHIFTLNVNETSYELTYSVNAAWQWGSKTLSDDGTYSTPGTCRGRYTFQVPEDYDGLVLRISSKLLYDPADSSDEISEEIHYAAEYLEHPEKTEYAKFYRIRPFQ